MRTSQGLITVEEPRKLPKHQIGLVTNLLRLRNDLLGDIVFERTTPVSVMHQGIGVANKSLYLTGVDGSIMRYR